MFALLGKRCETKLFLCTFAESAGGRCFLLIKRFNDFSFI